MSTIVVGIDGSPGSLHALGFAIAEARLRGADLKAVAAWEIPASVYSASWVPMSVDPGDFESIAKGALQRSLEDAHAKDSGVNVTEVVRQGQAADVLVDEAEGADLLVVGTRGFGGFKGLLLGSVSQQCVHHAKCPVAIVPDGDRAS